MMVGRTPAELEHEITTLCNEIWSKLADYPAASYSEMLALWQEVHGIYLATAAASLEQLSKKYELAHERSAAFDKIEAEAIVAEIVDKSTGKLYRRSLPVEYCETYNGVILSGETIKGTPSQIAFFSEPALTQIKELLGRGPDAPRCDHGQEE